MITPETVTSITREYEFEPIDPKASARLSFYRRDDLKKIHYYYNTGTVVVKTGKEKCKIIKNIKTLSKFESKILA